MGNIVLNERVMCPQVNNIEFQVAEILKCEDHPSPCLLSDICRSGGDRYALRMDNGKVIKKEEGACGHYVLSTEVYEHGGGI
ncbi:hypothetical protein ACFLZX_02535 [Nanoarchaeota archaeon]